MLLEDFEAESRLNSLDNLINKLRPSASQSYSGMKQDASPAVIDIIPAKSHDRIEIPSLPPSAESLVEDLEQKLRKQSIKNLATDVLEHSLEALRNRLDEVEKVRDLSKIAGDASKILKEIDPPKEENPNAKNQVIIYKPVMVTESHYNSVQVLE